MPLGDWIRISTRDNSAINGRLRQIFFKKGQ